MSQLPKPVGYGIIGSYGMAVDVFDLPVLAVDECRRINAEFGSKDHVEPLFTAQQVAELMERALSGVSAHGRMHGRRDEGVGEACPRRAGGARAAGKAGRIEGAGLFHRILRAQLPWPSHDHLRSEVHAPKIFRAVLYALEAAAPHPEARVPQSRINPFTFDGQEPQI